ncbi:alpha/beta fold hydrolase [Glaciecola siphonariae]|uniref:Alpha/beta fold hydrolase n=1 Tax=Glaciecola siphonariae TaxID=521012 RepID=A0ABV9LR52_9ALTE
MNSLKSCVAIMCVCMLFVSSALADTGPSPADFAKDSEFSSAKISPDGKHLAIIIRKDDKRRLAIVKADTLEPVGGADFGGKQQVGAFWWANNERIVMQILQSEPWSEDPSYYGELYAINLDGKLGEIIFGYRGGEQQVGTKLKTKEAVRGFADVVNLLPNDEDHILITVKPWSMAGLSQKTLHKLNINTGDLSSVVASTPLGTFYVVSTDEGEPVVAVGIDENYKRIIYSYNNGQYNDISDQGFGGGFEAIGVDEQGENLIYIDDSETNTTALYRMNLKSGKRALIYNNPKVDITGLALDSTDSVPLAIALDDGYPSYVLLDSASSERAIYEHLFSVFKGYVVSITSADDANEQFVIYAHNEIVPGQFYLYNAKTKKLRLLFTNKKELPSTSLSQSFPFSFAASDGAQIPAYITFPSHIPETQNVPLVVLVHGGPESRDYWRFNSEVQMLASRGYAVLRVNFRGSTGYGKKHQFAVRKNWGTLAQQDIIEATQYVINSGGIQTDKVCIMGSSFGGYSAVMSATIAPDLFTCVVASAGVYDLEQLKEEGNVSEYLLYGPAFLNIQLGSDPAQLKAQSPVTHVAKLKAPLLLAHGGDDYQVPIAHAKTLMTELDRYSKDYQWFTIDRAGHSFYEEESQIKYFETVAAFLDKHLK